MLTHQELFYAVVIPVLVSALIAAIGGWRWWWFLMPLAVGVGFLVSYALTGVPKLPPMDGSDWIFWLAIGLTVLAVGESAVGGVVGGAHTTKQRRGFNSRS